MTGSVNGNGGGAGGLDLAERARDVFNRIQDGVGNAAEALGLGDALTALDKLLASPSPLDRFASPQGEQPAARTTTPSPSPSPTSYTVRAGDTLSAIAERNGTTVAALVRENRLANPDMLSIGQKLTIPAAATRTADPTPTRATGATPGATSGTPATNGPSTGGLSANGMDFIYRHEAQTGVSNHLHWPKSASGVTLGPGYDMKGRSAAEITHDLTAIGVDPAAARKAGEAAGLTGSAARDFAAANKDLISLTPAQERQLLAQTVKGYADHVRDAIKVPVTQNQFDAMVSFAYNIGTSGFDGSTALRKLNAGDADGAAEAMKLWNKSDGRVNQGLVNRRNDEVTLFRTSGGPAATGATNQTADTAPVAETRAGGTSPDALARVIETNGDAQAKADLAAGKKVVVALRTETNTSANGGKGAYDDTIAVVWKDAQGKVHAQTFAGNTEPSGQYSAEGPKASRGSSVDLNGDGRNDLGRLQAGNFRYEQEQGTFLGNTFFRATRTQVAERDTNGDGRFDAGDGNRVDRSGAGRSMLIHQGGSDNTWSAGCQTIARNDFNQFVTSLGGQRAFSYVLVNAR